MSVSRRVGRSRGATAALLGAAVTAGAMTVGLTAPAAGALDLNAVTTGPLFGIAGIAGIDSVTVPDVPVLGSLTVNLAFTPAQPVALAEAVDAFPFGGFTPVVSTFKRQPGGALGTAILAGSGVGAFTAGLAYEALLAGAGGATPAGYPALVPSGRVSSVTGAPCTSGLTCVQGTNVTNLAVIQVNNPGTPNGGLFARFAPVLEFFGGRPVSIGGTSAASTGLNLNAVTAGIALGYNGTSDFPVSLNPFSLLNTLVATVLPTNLFGGATIAGADVNTVVTNLGTLAALNTPATSYSTLVPDGLALLEPLRLPSRLINALAGAVGIPLTLGTPLADALQPALTILVNTGYTDVQTPTDGGTYNRTFDQSGDPVPFLSQAPLTVAEWLQVPGDVVRALIVGFQNAFPILRFGQTAPVLTVDGNHLAITYPPAATPAGDAAAEVPGAPQVSGATEVVALPDVVGAAPEAVPAAAEPVVSPRSGRAVLSGPPAAGSRAEAPRQHGRTTRGPAAGNAAATAVPEAGGAARAAGADRAAASPRRVSARG